MMTFINEYISEEDRKKYNIDEINENYVIGGTYARDWTVDHDRGIYLRQVARGREDFSHITDWTFYWKECLLTFRMEIVETGRGDNGHRWSHMKITHIDIPEHLLIQRNEIIADIRSALEAYKDGGVFSRATTYSLILNVVEE